MALPAIFYGHLSDYFGRRKIMLFAGSFSLFGTFLCAVAPNVYVLIIGRVLQGIGFSGVSSSGRAILRDRMTGLELARYSAYLSMAIALSIDLAPFIGGYLQEWFGWRSNFWLIFLYNAIVLIITYKFTDTTVVIDGKITFKSLWVNLAEVSKNTKFLRYNIIAGFGYSMFMIYLAVASFIVQGRLGFSPVWFGSLTLALSFAFIGGSFVNNRMLKYFPIPSLIRMGLYIVMLSPILLIVAAIKLNIYTYIIGVIPMFVGLSFILPNSDALAFSNVHEKVGIAAAVTAVMRLLIAMIMVGLISIFNPHNTWAIAITIALLGCCNLYILNTLNPKLIKP